MKLPIQAQPVIRNVSTADRMNTLDKGITASGCAWWKALGCGAATAACGASCVLGPEVCIPCLAAIGAGNCLECLS